MTVKNFFKHLWSDERGQSTTEYILILSIVVMIALKFKTTFSKKLSTIVEDVGNQIDATVKQEN